MKQLFFAALLVAPLSVGAQSFVFEGAFPATATNPSVITADSTGAIYYGDFGSRTVYKVADPIAATAGGVIADVVFADLSSLAWGSGRGLQGIAVSTTGDVFISGDNGGGTPQGFVRKYSSVGSEDTSFTGTVDPLNLRSEGCALLSDDTLAIATFGGIEFLATADASQAGYTAASGAPNYTREISYNPTDNIIYPTRNGNNSAVKIAGSYAGGTAAAGGYTFTAADLIATGAIDSLYGTATSHGSFDDDTDRFFSVENDAAVVDVTVWSVTNSGTTVGATPDETIDVTPSVVTGFDGGSIYDAIYIDPYLYVSAYLTDSATPANNSGYVLVYKDTSSVSDWVLY